jgi:hypothetical protein
MAQLATTLEGVRRTLRWAIVVLSATNGEAWAQFTPEDFARIEWIGETAMSPAGAQVAYTRRIPRRLFNDRPCRVRHRGSAARTFRVRWVANLRHKPFLQATSRPEIPLPQFADAPQVSALFTPTIERRRYTQRHRHVFRPAFGTFGRETIESSPVLLEPESDALFHRGP